MASQKSKFAVGIFVAAGIGMTIVAVIFLGVTRHLQRGTHYATYFNESVQGLSKDSPVKYRGVAIGRVDRIEVAPDSKLIQVIMVIEPGYRLEKDIVAKLDTVGITGSMFIDLDRRKPEDPDRSPPITFPTEYPIVASRPSEISEILRGIDEVLKQFGAMDLGGISTKLKATLDGMNQALGDAEVKAVSRKVQASLDQIRGILDEKRWNAILSSLESAGASVKKVMAKAEHTMDRADTAVTDVAEIVAKNKETVSASLGGLNRAVENAGRLMERSTHFIENTDASMARLRQNLLSIAQNLDRATENLNTLLEFVSDYPSQVVLGENPTPREVGAATRVGR